MTTQSPLQPRWRKVLADLWESKMRTLLVVASIAVGVFAIGTIATAYLIISEDINVSYAAASPANIEIYTDPLDEDFVESIAKIPGVAGVEGRRVLPLRATNDGLAWQNLDAVAVEDYRESNINLLSLKEGTLYPDEREITVVQDMFNDTGFRLGEVIKVQLADDTVRNLTVVGIVAEQTNDRADLLSPPRGYVTLDTLDWLGQSRLYNRLLVQVSGDSNNEFVLQTVSDAVEDKIERDGRQVYRTLLKQSNEHPMASTILAVLGVLGALGGLILLLSSSLIVNTLNALLAQHLRQIGVMKLVGARSFQISGMYIILILLFGLMALIISVPSGAWAGYELSNFIVSLMNGSLQGFRLIPGVMVMQALVAILVPLLAGFFPVNRGSKIKVRRAISPDGQGERPATTSRFDVLSRWFGWLSRPLLLSIRNTFRRKGRLALTLFTLTMAGAIFIAVFNVRASLAQFMAQLGQHFMADVTLNFDQPYRIARVAQVALQVPGVNDIEAWAAGSGEIVDADDNVVENIQIIAPPADSQLIEPDMLAGRWLQPGDSHALVTANSIWDIYPDLQPGDRLRVSVLGKRAEEWMVVGVFRFTNDLGDVLAYTDYETMSRLLHTPDQAYSYRVVTDDRSLAGQKAMSAALDQALRARGFQVRGVEAGLEQQEQTATAVNILVIFLLAMAVLTAAVGSIGLMGTMGMNVLERTREIGVMRAIGAVDLEIIKSVVVEGVMIGLISWGIAVGLSFPISVGLLRIVSQAMIGAEMPLTVTPLGFGIWLLVVLILSVAASILPARNAARLTIREVLAYE
jgi:putative ABC transport system permease protein